MCMSLCGNYLFCLKWSSFVGEHSCMYNHKGKPHNELDSKSVIAVKIIQ
jgi:hypothetical protein